MLGMRFDEGRDERELPLLRTSEWDVQLEEYIAIHDELQRVIDHHGMLPCQGLKHLQPCNDCNIFYGNPTVGSRLAIKLARLNDELKLAVASDDGFDPRDYDEDAKYHYPRR